MAVQKLCRKSHEHHVYLFSVPPILRNADELLRVLQKNRVKTGSRSMRKGWKNLICLLLEKKKKTVQF